MSGGYVQTVDTGDLRAFPGLPEDHPSVGTICMACEWPLRPGDVTMIFAPQPDTVEDARRAEQGRPYTAVGNGLCHVDCDLAHAQLRDVLLGSPRCVLCGCTQNVTNCSPPCAWAPGHDVPVCTGCESADWGMPLSQMLSARGQRPMTPAEDAAFAAAKKIADRWNTCGPPTSIPPDAVRQMTVAVIDALPIGTADFHLSIDLGNAAMQTREDIAEALVRTAAKIEEPGTEGRIRDLNGNTVGGWTLTITEQEEDEHG